jgi:hypothetical protein
MFIRSLFVALLSAVLAACGGGGGSPGSTAGTITIIPTVIGSTSTFVTPTVANLSLSSIAANTTTLPSGGDASLSVTVLSNGVPSSTPVNISFLATCGKINGAVVGPSTALSVITNGSGVATVAYSAVGQAGLLCQGPTTVTANALGALPSSVILNVAAPVPNSIQFIGATPARIFVSGSGSVERSEVTFRVFAGSGLPLQGANVDLSLVTNPGGVGIETAGSTATITKPTDSNGDVRVGVFSGTIPGAIKLRAALSANAVLFSESQNLSIASGPPSQRFMSLSVEKFNIEGWAVDGSSTKLTARIADRQGNAVDDGTVVNFTAEGGQVASTCATVKVNNISSCAVDFISQNPRPAGGRVSVLAYLEGTKDYVDVNSNNIFNNGVDTLINLGDAFRDDDEGGTYSVGEFVVPRGGASVCSGATAPFPARLNTCDTSLSTTVRQQAVLLYSSSEPVLLAVALNTSGITAQIGSRDNPLLPMPVGTTIVVEASGGICSIDKQFGSPVVNVLPGVDPSADLTTEFRSTFKTCAIGNSIFVRVTSPGGLTTIFDFVIRQ